MLASEFITKIRIAVIAFLIFGLYTALAIRLWQVQVLRGEDTREKVSMQYIRKIRMPAVRGRILTADGVPLADNRPSYDVVFHISEMRRPNARANTVNYVFRQIGRAAEAIGRKDVPSIEDVAEHISRSPGLPLTAFRDLSREETARAYELSTLIPGMDVICDAVRIYPHGSLAGHLIGYVRRDDPLNADDRRGYSYYVPDIVGKSGIELACDNFPGTDSSSSSSSSAPSDSGSPETPDAGEDLTSRPLLRGTPGKKLIIVDHRRFVRDTIGPVIPAENGKSIILTLNYRAQETVERLLLGLSAAMIVMESDTGKIVAMASAPSYSPQDFVPSISRDDYNQLLSAPDRPLFNKALMGAYSPGSIIKPVMATAILSAGIDPEEKIECDGATPVGSSSLKCWIYPLTGSGHGPVDLREAITVSCNDYFATRGLELGVDKISEAFALAGIGRKTGFLLSETSGRLPSRKRKPDWNAFDTALISIGQGEVLISPLQAAVYVSAIANGGTLYRPQILQNIVDDNGNTVFTAAPDPVSKLNSTAEQLARIREAMYNSVHAENGGSRTARNTAVELSGKTGTAEMGPREKRYKNTWFTGFGRSPADGRLYTVVVFVEHGLSGGRSAAPIAAEFFEQWIPE